MRRTLARVEDRRFSALALRALLAASMLTACAGPDPVAVSYRVVTSPGDDPLHGATTLRLVLRQGGADVALVEGPLASGFPALPEVPFGNGYRLRVEARDHDVVLARGSSFPFDVDLGGASIEPAVLVGRVVQFAPVPAVSGTLPPGSAIVAALATPTGALLVTETGTVYLYRHHPTAAEPLTLQVLEHIPDRAGATWCVLPGAGLLGVGGVAPAATVLDASGAVLATSSDAALLPHIVGASLIALSSDAPVALALGGAPALGAPPTGAVTQLELVDGVLVVRPVLGAVLPTPIERAGAALVHIDLGGVEEPRVVLAGGVGELGATGTAVFVDPAGVVPSTEVPLGVSLRGCAVVALSTRLVLVAGGAADDGIPSAVVRLLSADAAGLSVVTPPPRRPLSLARTNAGALRLAEGLVLLVGGTGLGGAPLTVADLVRVDLETFPGDVLPTGSLPWPQPSPKLVVLGDGTVLSADASGLAFYVSPVEVL